MITEKSRRFRFTLFGICDFLSRLPPASVDRINADCPALNPPGRLVHIDMVYPGWIATLPVGEY